MLLCSILKQMQYSEPYQIECERSFDILALCASDVSQASLVFLDGEAYLPLVKPNVTMALTTRALAGQLLEAGVGVCVCEHPRLLFFLLHNFLSTQEGYERPRVASSFGANCRISPLSCIAEHNVQIGDRVVIEEFVTIRENTEIGNDVIIRAGSRIGGLGFEFKRSGDGILAVEHAGGVVIRDHVEIRENVCIDRAIYPWDDTVIGEHCKIDNLVYIAHAVKLGRNVLIVANSGIGGRTVVGDDSWIGLGATITNGTTMGSHARANIGSVVTKPVPDGGSVSGNFAIDHARFLENLKDSIK